MAPVLSALIATTLATAPMAGAPPGSCPSPAAPIAAACAAAPPAAGEAFSGTVLQVIDGQTLCVAQGSDPAQWILVKLADAPNGAARSALMAAAFAQKVVCVADRREGDGVAAYCALGGAALGGLIRSRAVGADAALWR